MKTLIRLSITVCAICLLASPLNAGETHTFLVEGMHCGGCAYSVEDALRRVGIQKRQIIEILYGDASPKKQMGSVKVDVDPEADHGHLTDCKIIAAIKKYSGYIAHLDPEDKTPCPK